MSANQELSWAHDQGTSWQRSGSVTEECHAWVLHCLDRSVSHPITLGEVLAAGDMLESVGLS